MYTLCQGSNLSAKRLQNTRFLAVSLGSNVNLTQVVAVIDQHVELFKKRDQPTLKQVRHYEFP